MCDWRMKKINKRVGGVRERSSEGKAATIFIYGGFQKNSPWRRRRATSPPPNLVPVHRHLSRSFSISSNSVHHPRQCARPSSRLQYQLVHHGRQGPCRQRAVQSNRQRVDDGVATSSNAPASSRLSTSPTNGTPTSFTHSLTRRYPDQSGKTALLSSPPPPPTPSSLPCFVICSTIYPYH